MNPKDCRPKDLAEWADFWRYIIGVNVIPANTKSKNVQIGWKGYQNNPITKLQHEIWKKQDAFANGLAMIPGRVWHKDDKNGIYFISIDVDKEKGIKELCTINGKVISLHKMAEKFLVEQHKDNQNKAHISFYSSIPFPQKTPDTVIGLEVKGLGDHGIVFCSPSIHMDGAPYEIIGTTEPVVLNLKEACGFIQHINSICTRYGVRYLEKDSNLDKLKPMINSLKIDPTIRIQKGERHIRLISTADSLLLKHLGTGKNKKTEQWLKKYFVEINRTLCNPGPLPQSEIDSIWNSAVNFVQDLRKEKNSEEDKTENEEVSMVEESSEAIKKKYKFVTVSESKDILYYKDGVYIHGGETLIEKEAEMMYGYDLSNKLLVEIKGHIMRSTYRNKDEFDADINILNLKNGLYNIVTGESTQHTPNCISLNQIPIIYNPRAKTRRFGRFLSQVLYSTEIRTAVELMAYTLYKDNPFEIITVLFGYGSNGKSVFTGLLTSLLGIKNVSNVPLRDMLRDAFALSDLEDKNVNIDTELSSATIFDAAILKKLTGKQPVRIQRKNQRAYDTRLYAKLFFSANKVPESADDSDAYYRRNVILSFPTQFEEGKNADPELLAKLTTEEELSGIFNILMVALRNVLKHKRIFVNEKTIQERRIKYELASNPIECFKQDAIAEESTEYDRTLKETLYHAYEIFARENKLAIISKESLGKILKSKHGFQEGRESAGKRRTFWKGIKLAERYRHLIKSEQHVLTV